MSELAKHGAAKAVSPTAAPSSDLLARRALAMEAALCLVGARIALMLLPFSWLVRRWGAFVAVTDPRVQMARTVSSSERAQRAAQIGVAVTTASRRLPFQTVCLPRAIAARWMLQRRHIPSVMHFGAAKGKDRLLSAHAWLEAEGVGVTGYPVDPGLAEIGCFVPGRASDLEAKPPCGLARDQ